MLKRSLILGALLLCLCMACVQDRISGDESNRPGGSVSTGLVMDSLDFLITDGVILRANELLYNRKRQTAYAIYDSLLQIGISDPYLEFYVRTRKLNANFRKMEFQASMDSIASLKQISKSLIPFPFYLRLELALVEGNIAYREEEYLQVVKSLDFLQKVEIKDYGKQLNRLIFDGYNRIGRANFTGFQNYYRAKDWFTNQSNIAAFMPEIPNKSLGVLNYLLARVSRNLNDFELGLSYCEKGIDYFERCEPLELWRIAIAKSEQVVLLVKIGKYKKASETFATLLELAEEGSLQDDLVFTFINNYAGVLFEEEQIREYEKALKILESRMNSIDTSQMADVIERKAWLAELTGDYTKLVEYQRVALNIYSNYSKADSMNLAHYFSNLGLAFQKIDQLDSAVYYLHQGIQIKFNEKFQISNPPVKIASMAYRDFDTDLGPLALAVQKTTYPTGSLNSNLKLAEKYYELIFLLFDKYKTGREEGAILRDLGGFHTIFGEAIACKYFSNNGKKEKQNQIYEIMEKGKATLLFKSIYLRAMADQFGLPDTLFQSLIEVNQKISELDERGFEGANDISYASLVRAKENIVFEIKNRYPSFFNAVRAPKQIALEQIQNRLESNQVLIQYYWSTQGLFIISISADEVRLKRCDNIESLKNDLNDFVKILQSPPINTDESYVQDYANLAFHLDTTLLSGMLPENGIKEIIIIPDGPISNLPFETLVQERSTGDNASFYNLNYRVRDYSISYGFSGSLFYHQNTPYKTSNKANIKLFAFTDHELLDFSNLDSLSMELPASSIEVDAVEAVLKNYDVLKWKGPNCKKEIFEKEAVNSDVIHLALHGKSNPDNRFGNHILFPNDINNRDFDNILYSHELKKFNIKAKFVFLSACEAGYGKSELGEGIYSLGRGFANAGVPSLVMGLWEINDQISAKMAEKFYESLVNGEKINTALKRAKNACLDESAGIIAHPYYWSPLIAIGGMQNPLE